MDVFWRSGARRRAAHRPVDRRRTLHAHQQHCLGRCVAYRSAKSVWECCRDGRNRNFDTRLESRLSVLLYVDCALVRERFEPEDPMITAHAALIDATEWQLVLQIVREDSVYCYAAR